MDRRESGPVHALQRGQPRAAWRLRGACAALTRRLSGACPALSDGGQVDRRLTTHWAPVPRCKTALPKNSAFFGLQRSSIKRK